MDNFDLKKYLIENKITRNSKTLEENTNNKTNPIAKNKNTSKIVKTHSKVDGILFERLEQLISKIDILTEVSIQDLKTQFVDTGKVDEKTWKDVLEASGNKSALATWLLSRVVGNKKKGQEPVIKPEDIYKWKDYFIIFNRNKSKYEKKDLNQVKTSQDIRQFLQTTLDIKNQQEEDPSKQKGIAKSEKYEKFKIGEVDGFTVYKIPQGAKDLYNTSCELGSGTEWCTATGKTRSYFDSHIKDGPLYIFDNGKGEKYQFHYESNQFMDKNDNSVI